MQPSMGVSAVGHWPSHAEPAAADIAADAVEELAVVVEEVAEGGH